MRFLVALPALLLLLPLPAFSQFSMELDLDGTTGNGPDVGSADLGDTVEVDLWAHGNTAVLSFGAKICPAGAALACLDAEYGTTLDDYFWSHTPPVIDTCITLTSTQFTMNAPPPLPILLATLRFRAAMDDRIETIGIEDGGIFTTLFSTVSFDVPNACSIVIGEPTATEPAAWGSIKRLFR